MTSHSMSRDCDPLAGRRTRARIVLTAALCVAGLDQITKGLAILHLTPVGERARQSGQWAPAAAWSARAPCRRVSERRCTSLRVWGPLSWRYVENAGGGWSSARDARTWKLPALIAVGALVAVLMLGLAGRMDDGARRLSLSAAAGGVLGNLIDRVHRGYVVDFAAVGGSTWRFPVFNLADVALTLGLAGFLVTAAARWGQAVVADTATDGYGGRRG